MLTGSPHQGWSQSAMTRAAMVPPFAGPAASWHRPLRAAAVAPREVARCRAHGFTLVELALVLALLSLLAALALPTFIDSVRKSRRAEAYGALFAVQQAQERWRDHHDGYADTLGPGSPDAPGLGMAARSPGGYYSLHIAQAGPHTYTLVAVGNDGTTQADDRDCRQLAVRMQGGSLQYAGCGDCADFRFAATHACWAR